MRPDQLPALLVNACGEVIHRFIEYRFERYYGRFAVGDPLQVFRKSPPVRTVIPFQQVTDEQPGLEVNARCLLYRRGLIEPEILRDQFLPGDEGSPRTRPCRIRLP